MAARSTSDRSTGRTRARNRSSRGRGRPAGRPAGWWSVHHPAGRAQRGARHARPGHLADRRRHSGQRAAEPAGAASGQRPARRAISASPTSSGRARRTTRRTTRRRTRCSTARSSATPAGSTPRSARARWRSPTTISARRCDSGKRALALSHGFSPPALAMIGDASVELGRYQQGFAAFARLGQLRPGLVAYARLSYSRELQGDVAGATRLMRRAVDAGSGAPENTQWTRVQLAALLLKSGHTDAAAREYRHALALLPDYARAEAGLGAVAVARGNLAAGASSGTSARPRTCRCPTSSRSSATCARRAATRPAPRRPTRSCGVENALFIRAGGNADLETALFDASHPGRSRAPAVVALARKALAFRPSIYGHDALAWALYCGRQVPPGAAAGQAREPPRHDRPAALVAPRRDRGLRRQARPGARGAARRRWRARRTSTRSTPRPRGGCWRGLA